MMRMHLATLDMKTLCVKPYMASEFLVTKGRRKNKELLLQHFSIQLA